MEKQEVFGVGISTYPLTQKPGDKDGKAFKRIKIDAFKNYKERNLEEIIDLVGNKGYAIVPARLQGWIDDASFVSAQVFMIDFDGIKKGKGVNISYDEVKSRAQAYGLEIAFAYKTLSCPDNVPFYKFRVVFVHYIPIPDINLARLLIHILLKIFPEADKACSDLARMFLGGKEVIDSNPYARIDLVQTLPHMYKLLDNNFHRVRNLRQLIKRTDIAIINNKIAVESLDKVSIFGLKADSDKINIIGESSNKPIFYVDNKRCTELVLHHLNTCMRKTKHKIQLNNLEGCCQLLDIFMSGEYVDHMEKFTLLLNLKHLQGGTKLFYECLEKFYDEETVSKWNVDYDYTDGYAPMACSEHCRFFKNCHRNEKTPNIVLKLLNDRSIRCTRIKEYVTIEEAEASLAENFEKAMRSTQKGIHLIGGQTGIGKTYTIISYLKEHHDMRVLIAEPTCIMKEEITKKLELAVGKERVKMIRSVRDVDIMISLKEYLPKVSDEYMNYHESGQHARAKQVLKEALEFIKESMPEADALIESLEELIKGMKNVEDQNIVVITHAFLLTMKPEDFERFDHIIIDEDILMQQILGNTKRISLRTIDAISRSGVIGYSQMAGEMLNAKEGEYYKLKSRNEKLPEWDMLYRKNENDKDDKDEDERIIQDTDNNIGDLARAGAYVLQNNEYTYFCVSGLPLTKYIVLSATANKAVYEAYFKEYPVIAYDVKEARYKGRLEQYTYHSLGRGTLREFKPINKSFIMEFIKEHTGNEDAQVVTFKEFEGLNKVGLHFGNAIGVNSLKGEDIAIIGTPFKNPVAYLLPCCYIYGEESVSCIDKRVHRIDYKGYNFRLMTFSDLRLQNYECYCLESDLEQCIGRARLLRCDATVIVLSSFPCEQAVIHTSDYLEGHIKEQEQS